MYTKSFLLVLLGCSLVLASPVEQSSETRVARSILGTFANWLHKADETVDAVFQKVEERFKKLYNSVIETGESVAKFSKEQIQQALDKYNEIKNKYEENLNQLKNQLLDSLAAELQEVIDVLSNAEEENLEKLKQKVHQIAESAKKSLLKAQKKLEEAIKAEKEKLQEELDKWEAEANEFDEE